MEFARFKEAAFEYALKSGCGAAEAYFVNGEEFEAAVLNGKLDEYKASRYMGVNLRVQVGGKNGYAYTEVLEEPEELVNTAIDNARAIENTDEQPMQGPVEYAAITPPEQPLLRLSNAERIELALKLEQAALKADERVQRVSRCMVIASSGSVTIANTLGLNATRQEELSLCYVVPVVQQGEEVKDGFAFRVNAGVMDVEACAQEAVQEAVTKLSASPVPGGKYRVLLRADAAADLLEAFFPMFSADNAQKGLSLLKGMEGKGIASGLISIVDDAFYPGMPRQFDGEGVPSKKTAVVEKGVLNTLLHNLKTAKKAGVESTANGSRGASTPVDVGPSNFYILPGEKGLEELMQELGSGLLITSLSGLHAGVDAVSGEFSLLSSGMLVENGKPVRPVERITVGGLFIETMRNVYAVGGDLRFGLPGTGRVGSPSLLISELMVGGD